MFTRVLGDSTRLAPTGSARSARIPVRKESRLGRERILFICTANVDRSRTAEDLYRDDPRYEVLSAGLAPFASTPVTRDLLQWADRVFVMCEKEEQHRTLLRMRFPDVRRPVVVLDIEDRWYRGDPELVRRMLKSLGRHLGAPRKPGED
jgi:predicted protein tyrosine phosphatase